MADLPATQLIPVVRTDFSDDASWQRLLQEILTPTDGSNYGASVEFVEDRALAGLDDLAIATGYDRGYPHQYQHPVLFVVDAVAISAPDHPVLVVNLNAGDDSGPFRTLPQQVQAIEVNLSISNMDYFEFARAVDADGVFRGF